MTFDKLNPFSVPIDSLLCKCGGGIHHPDPEQRDLLQCRKCERLVFEDDPKTWATVVLAVADPHMKEQEKAKPIKAKPEKAKAVQTKEVRKEKQKRIAPEKKRSRPHKSCSCGCGKQAVKEGLSWKCFKKLHGCAPFDHYASSKPGRHSSVTEQERSTVVRMAQEGSTDRQIEAAVGLARSTCNRIVRQYYASTPGVARPHNNPGPASTAKKEIDYGQLATAILALGFEKLRAAMIEKLEGAKVEW